MPSTYLSLHYHLVFSTKNRQPSISDRLAPDLHAYMGGIIRALGGVALAVGGVADHVHVLVGLKPVHSVASVIRDLKSGSSQWVHQRKRDPGFWWQEGYAAITISPVATESVRRYIETQREHHHKREFREELIEMLRDNGIAYNEEFLD